MSQKSYYTINSTMRRKEAADSFNISIDTFDRLIKKGLITKPFNMTGQNVFLWLVCELEAVFNARVAGHSDTQIKRMVAALERKRII